MDHLLESHQEELFGYLQKVLGNHADAEDVLQQTMLQTTKKLRWLREPEHFRPWAYRIASRMAFRVLKQRQRKMEISNVERIDETETHSLDDGEHVEWIACIPEWLEKLTPKGREVVALHYLQGFTAEQVAEILNIPVGTVKSRISYSLTCIRKLINHHSKG